MISSQPAIPLLVHEDCMNDIKTDLAGQQASLSDISNNTESAKDTLRTIETAIYTVGQGVQEIAMNTVPLEQIENNTSSIKTSSSNAATQLGTIKTDTTALTSSVGTTADASTSNTVIGLLKSIANKL